MIDVLVIADHREISIPDRARKHDEASARHGFGYRPHLQFQAYIIMDTVKDAAQKGTGYDAVTETQ
jgi:hypothetical protein